MNACHTLFHESGPGGQWPQSRVERTAHPPQCPMPNPRARLAWWRDVPNTSGLSSERYLATAGCMRQDPLNPKLRTSRFRIRPTLDGQVMPAFCTTPPWAMLEPQTRTGFCPLCGLYGSRLVPPGWPMERDETEVCVGKYTCVGRGAETAIAVAGHACVRRVGTGARLPCRSGLQLGEAGALPLTSATVPCTSVNPLLERPDRTGTAFPGPEARHRSWC